MKFFRSIGRGFRKAGNAIANIFRKKKVHPRGQQGKGKVNNNVYEISESLRAEYLKNWLESTINSSHRKSVERIVDKILEKKKIYEEACELSGYDFFFMVTAHYRECGNDLNRQLLNGQRWTQRTTLVPKGLGPFQSFQDSCKKAFDLKPKMKNPRNISELLHALERHNGWGYRRRGIWSPYIWSYTTLYTTGYYTSDGNFSMKAVNRQSGCAAILKVLFDRLNYVVDKDGNIVKVVQD